MHFYNVFCVFSQSQNENRVLELILTFRHYCTKQEIKTVVSSILKMTNRCPQSPDDSAMVSVL